jgi:hypothetical protein
MTSSNMRGMHTSPPALPAQSGALGCDRLLLLLLLVLYLVVTSSAPIDFGRKGTARRAHPPAVPGVPRLSNSGRTQSSRGGWRSDPLWDAVLTVRLASDSRRTLHTRPPREFYLRSNAMPMSTSDQITGVAWSRSDCSMTSRAQPRGHVHGDVLARSHHPGGDSLRPRLYLHVSLVVQDGGGCAIAQIDPHSSSVRPG